MTWRKQSAAVVLVGLLLSGCATPQPGEDAEALSTACSIDLIYEWDGSRGPESPAAAIESTLSWFEQKASELRGTAADPTRALAPEDDPVLAAITVRGLQALLKVAEDGGTSERGQSHDYEALAPSGEPFAFATILEQPEGGYRVDVLRVRGFVSDHPDC